VREERLSQTSSPTVAVVVPVFNPGKLLIETLESVRRQSHPCEVILVDDGSTDETTLEILAAVDPAEALVIRQSNRGAAAARNAGIRRSGAKYILPLDADDLIEPDYLAKAVEVLESEPDVGIVYCHADFIGDVVGPWQLPDYSPAAMVVDNIIFVSALFRREDWQSVGGYDETLLSGGEDWDFWLSLIDLGREVVRLPDTLFHYRIHGEERSFHQDELAELFTTVTRKHERLFVENVDALYRHRFDALEELRRLRQIEARAAKLRRVMPPLSSWLRGETRRRS
jgi:glycosyltransferase involved in cell wall biosynthesis